jgi:cellulose synthase/poly-beta-1,6-N-acetylglucosamine synthase-like glycosyltransferase
MQLEFLIGFSQAVIFILSIFLVGVAIYHLLVFLAAMIKMEKVGSSKPLPTEFKTVSLIIPMRDEFSALSQLIKSLEELDYPAEFFEVIFVAPSESKHILEKYLSRLSEKKIRTKLVVDEGNGKPAALNRGLTVAEGEIVGIFDVDSVLPVDILKNVSKSFSEKNSLAAQGIARSYNTDYNILSKLASLEQVIYLKIFLQPRSFLNLFIPSTGSCFFVKKDLLLKLGGWRDDLLAEDFDLSLRIHDEKIKIKLDQNIYCWQETPSRLKDYFIQRLRWFRGFIQLLPSNLHRLTTPEGIDIFLLLLGPLVLCSSLLVFTYVTLTGFILPSFLGFLASLLAILTPISFMCLTIRSKTSKMNLILALLGIAAYWMVESIIATIAILTALLRLKVRWIRTPKTGIAQASNIK